MSKSYGNAIAMREEPAEVTRKIRHMQTDPARVRRSDPGRSREVPGVAAAQGLLERGDQGLGRRRLHDARRSAASTASSR